MYVNSVLEAEKENVIKINESSVSSQSSKVLSDSLSLKTSLSYRQETVVFALISVSSGHSADRMGFRHNDVTNEEDLFWFHK